LKYSPSSLFTYYTCPWMFKLAYIDKVKPLPPVENLEFGSDVHKIIAAYYELIPNSLTENEIPMYLSQAVKRVGVDFENVKWVLRGFMKFESRRLLWNLNPKPVAIEKMFERGCFYGVVDAIFKKFDGSLVGVDWKTGRVNTDNVHYVLAGFIYTYVANLNEMIFVSLHTGEEVKLTSREIPTFKNVIREVVGGIRAGKFEKRVGDWCNECQYSIACELGVEE
jgi:hypothetical protein